MQDLLVLDARQRRWSVMRGGALLWRSWDRDEHVVYSTSSGDTHLVNEVTATVLRTLERGEIDFSRLSRHVASSLGAELDPQVEDHVAKLLVYLDQLGLVESVP